MILIHNPKMSYFPGQSLHPQLPNPPLNYQQSDVPPHFQSIPSVSSFSDPYHGFYPYSDSGGVYNYPSNYQGYVAQPINQLDNNGVSPSWVVKEAAPIKYSPAIQPLSTEAMPSTSYEVPVNYTVVGQKMINKVPKKKIKRLKVTPNNPSLSRSVRCELCKIECNTVQAYEKHLSGKKHNKGLQKCYPPALQSAAVQAPHSSNVNRGAGEVVTPGGQGVAGVTSKPVNLQDKKQKLLEAGTAIQAIRVCTVCNVTCNGEIAFADHLVGKKHASQQRAQTAHATTVNLNTAGTNAQDSTKKRKNGEAAPLWCDVCKISCTSSDGLNIHLVGKKHKKNLLKLQNPIPNSNTNTPSSIAAALPSTTSSTGVPAPEASLILNQAKAKVRSKEPEDVEVKKRNILESGAASNAVRTCTLCNVVCNSETVFKSHLSGQKHATMVKQAQVAGAGASNGVQVVVNPAA